MRPVVLVTVLGLGLGAASCRKAPPREAPDGGQADAPAPTQSPEPVSHSRLIGGPQLTGSELFRFIAVSRQVTAALRSAGRPFEASPDGFVTLDSGVPGDEVIDAALDESRMAPAEWSKLGARAWAAWSVAQADYNAETTLRDNARRLAQARRRLTTAEASLQSGDRVLSDAEREIRVTSLQDAAMDANDRADMWATTAATLRDRIDAIVAMAESLNASANADGNNADAATTTALNNSLTDLAATHTSLTQDLAAAERNERDARDEATRDAAASLHPEHPMSDAELADLRREAAAMAQRCKSEIARLQAESDKLQDRLDEEHGAEARARTRAASEADVALLRDHLQEFNAAWGLGIDGVAAVAPRRTTTSSR